MVNVSLLTSAINLNVMSVKVAASGSVETERIIKIFSFLLLSGLSTCFNHARYSV